MSHNLREIEELTKRLRQLQYSRNNGFVEDEKYEPMRKQIIERIRELSGK